MQGRRARMSPAKHACAASVAAPFVGEHTVADATHESQLVYKEYQWWLGKLVGHWEGLRVVMVRSGYGNGGGLPPTIIQPLPWCILSIQAYQIHHQYTCGSERVCLAGRMPGMAAKERAGQPMAAAARVAGW